MTDKEIEQNRERKDADIVREEMYSKINKCARTNYTLTELHVLLENMQKGRTNV